MARGLSFLKLVSSEILGRGRQRSVVIQTTLILSLVVVATAVAAAGGFVLRNLYYANWEARRVSHAGLVEKTAAPNGAQLHYAEGPANGPSLLLIHGQLTDWRSYSRVLPKLSKHFHVFAVDCYGHGGSAHDPGRYTARAHVSDLQLFLRKVVKSPAIVAGHSSGGLIAAGLAAAAPDLVRAVLLEDPPFFSSVSPKSRNTFNYLGLASTAHKFLQSGERDFVRYFIRHAGIWDLFKGAKQPSQRSALAYVNAHPGKSPLIWYMPPLVNESYRALNTYDPRFGQAFYDDSFHAGFDHAEVLRGIKVPAVLIHANWSYSEDGVLLAAMDDDDAAQARSLIQEVEFVKVDTGHGFHFEDPDHFIGLLLGMNERLTK